jgi:restriction system protein
MPLPTYEQIMAPLLKRMAGLGQETSMAGLLPDLATDFGLTEDELAERLPSGKQTTFANRCAWSKWYLVRAGLLEATRRAHFTISQEGRAFLAATPGPIDRKTLLTIPAFAAWWAENGKSTSSDAPPDAATIEAPSSATPDDQIDSAANLISAAVEADMLSRVRSVTSARFEQIVVDLLIAMGYGGGDPEMGKRLGRTGDGGIDGVIQQDALGLDAIYIQAKRYKDGSNIGPETIRGFIGSLAIARASKGVFVTSSKFTADAKKGAASTQHRIILIDGEELARLLVRHGVGVRDDRTIVIKKLDEDYFADE